MHAQPDEWQKCICTLIHYNAWMVLTLNCTNMWTQMTRPGTHMLTTFILTTQGCRCSEGTAAQCNTKIRNDKTMALAGIQCMTKTTDSCIVPLFWFTLLQCYNVQAQDN